MTCSYIARLRAATIVVVLTAAATLNSAYAGTNPPPSVVEGEILKVFHDAPIMVRVAKCESTLAHYDKDGRVKKNPKSSAHGLFQILAKTHGPGARKRNLDIMTIEGNIRYARVLYEERGLKPWTSSRGCWGGNAVKAKTTVNKAKRKVAKKNRS